MKLLWDIIPEPDNLTVLEVFTLLGGMPELTPPVNLTPAVVIKAVSPVDLALEAEDRAEPIALIPIVELTDEPNVLL